MLFSIPSFAQSINTNLKTLSDNADIIVEGKVIQKKSSWDKNKTRIYTDVTLQVNEYLKGNKGNNTLVVKTLGGEVGSIGELYTHTPKFENDEEVLLFVKENKKDNSYRVFNGDEGKVTLYSDKVTGEKITASNKNISSIKSEIKSFVNKQLNR